MHRIAVLALDDVVAFDLSIPAQIFGHHDERDRYALTVCGRRAGPVRTSTGFAIVATAGLRAVREADTVVIPGIEATAPEPDAAVIAALRAADRRGARMISICTGAFVLAAAGLLDGRRATTHWEDADELRRDFPAVRVEEGPRWIDEGALVTSAGISAGIDMSLHLVRRLATAELAVRTARQMDFAWEDRGA